MKKSFNIQELLHCKSKCHGINPMHPSSWRAFERHQELDLKHHGLVDLVTPKQNKLPSFIDRWCSKKNFKKTQIWKVPCLFQEYGAPKKTLKKHKSEKFHASFRNMVFQKNTFKKHKYEKFNASLLRNGLNIF